ncbi:hypothetical protein [Aeromicrobium wangtongii]|uniref:hypothetical protein n=1 Tax=Aeromicrobium wangtongii TaxID=2969247 RepID=UPI002017CE9B|nr:hypothetical protein [Aeromicrobium wangtongii]MCL3819716.1 hypothetical protein [Aeromicrobium wangtongii]
MVRTAVVAALLVLTACGSQSDGPARDGAGEAVKELLGALDAGSCAQVKSIVVTPDAIDCEQIQDLAGSYSDDGVDLDRITVKQGDTVDGSTTVTVDLGTDEADEQWQAEQVDGSWRVLFDSPE